jgi:3-dehydroquinate dehydratase II
LNTGACGHTSVALPEALSSPNKPLIEVYLSNIYPGETFRQHSYVSLAADGVICGLGPRGYVLALDALAAILEEID